MAAVEPAAVAAGLALEDATVVRAWLVAVAVAELAAALQAGGRRVQLKLSTGAAVGLVVGQIWVAARSGARGVVGARAMVEGRGMEAARPPMVEASRAFPWSALVAMDSRA